MWLGIRQKFACVVFKNALISKYGNYAWTISFLPLNYLMIW